MLASSPLHHEPHQYVENIFLYHGENDSVVPLWNVEQMDAHLNSLGVNVQTTVYEEATHSSFNFTPEHHASVSLAVTQFLDNINFEQ